MTPSAIISLVLGLLKFANFIMNIVQEKKWMDAGRDAEVARASAAILRKTEIGKRTMEKVDAMSESDVDAALINLEPK